jgi:hypothetical protein
VLGVEPAGYTALKQANDAEDARERVRLQALSSLALPLSRDREEDCDLEANND